MSISESLDELRSELGDLPERISALLEDHLKTQPPPQPDWPLADVGAQADSLGMPAPSQPAGAAPPSASDAPWFPSSWGGSGGAASGGAGFAPPEFPEPSLTGFNAPEFASAAAGGGFSPGAFPEPSMTGFQSPDWTRQDAPLPFPEPAALAAGGGSGGGLAGGRTDALLQQLLEAVQGGGGSMAGGPLRSSYPGLGTPAPGPAVAGWSASWQEPVEGFAAASPSMNQSNLSGLRGAGGFGYGSRLNMPQSDFLEPSRRFPDEPG